ncbi:hypothetical protein [Bradyrhizobium sp. BR 10289]|uniref:hypothetical protein n=1 Tax=Bradyrhizobium sp. BR 10289 TaxID=2749993 RepID=UPI001C64C552|nr:hypothetical protein [Bradyrhizobium sp. BR 10289]MBW7968323.1 hypothetical protein [Bradyrhizobium sp. BR 10289]
MTSMVRPTRSIVVTGIPISAARPEMQSAEKEISFSPFCGQFAVCILQGTVSVTNAWAIAKVAGGGRRLYENCRPLMRVSSATFGSAPSAPESGFFRRIFAVRLHDKVRAYDAGRCGRFAVIAAAPAAGEKRPQCGLLAR